MPHGAPNTGAKVNHLSSAGCSPSTPRATSPSVSSASEGESDTEISRRTTGNKETCQFKNPLEGGFRIRLVPLTEQRVMHRIIVSESCTSSMAEEVL